MWTGYIDILDPVLARIGLPFKRDKDPIRFSVGLAIYAYRGSIDYEKATV